MFGLYEQSSRLIELSGHLKQTNASLAEKASSIRTEFTLGEGQRLDLQGEYFFIEEGLVQCELEGIPLVYMCEGDLLSPLFYQDKSSHYTSLTSLRGSIFQGSKLVSLFYEDNEIFGLFQDYQSLSIELFLELLRKESVWLSSDAIPTIRAFQSGDPIIIQDTSASEVYTLLYGSASVYVKDKQVGQILQNEIFGTLSLADEKVRNASVIANSQCVVASIPEEKFTSLLTTHPETVTRLVRSMARIIVSQNEQLAE